MTFNTQISHKTSERIINSIHDNIKNIFPLTVGNKTLEVNNVNVSGWENADSTNYHAIAEAKAKDKTYGVNVMGDVVLKENGIVLDKKRMKLATAPVMAGDGTFIVGGSQYQIDNQLRLRPGIYSRIKQNGEIEAHVNPDGFKNLRLAVDPATQKLTVNVNQANINAIPVLRILGIKDDLIKKTFGLAVYDANIKAIGNKGDDEIKRFFKSVHPYEEIPATHEAIAEHLATSLKQAKLDPKVTHITLGQEFKHVNGQALLRGLEKVVNVSRGIEHPDDRDALAFKTIHSVEDFVGERIAKNKKQIQFSIENRMRKNDKLDQIMNAGHINQHIFSFFNSASLSEIPSQINPLAVINSSFKTTITGEGGIENAESIMPESQALHPSHLGYLDPINTPESKKVGVTLNLAIGTSKVGNELHTSLRNIHSNKLENVSTIDAYHKVIALPDQVLRGKVTAIKNGKQVEVDANEVTHQLPSAYAAFTVASQVLPGLNHNDGGRAGMASRHINQAISLKHREAPLVQTQSSFDKNLSSEQFFGRNFEIALHAEKDGEINKITKSHIEMKDGTKYPLFTHFDLQNKSYLHHEIDHLKPGMKFKKGDLIADSNFSKNGTLSLGANLRTAYMPWKGLNFEDGIVVSETAAKKLTSNHLFQDNIQKDNDSIIVNKRKFVTMYPTLYSKEQLDKIDDNGLAKAGVTLNPGDPYALVLNKTQGTQEDLMLNRLHKSLVQPYKDSSKTWDQLTPGNVTKSIENTKNVKLHAQYESPANLGDKLALRHGNKGVISAILPDHEMPTSKEGRHTEVILSPLSVITRMSMAQMLENSASKIAEKTGKPYIIENFSKTNQLDKIREDLKKHGLSDTEELFDQHGKSFGHIMVGQPLVEKLFKTAKANVSARDAGAYDIDNKPIKGGEDGSKAIDQLTLYGLLSHGARGIVNEVSTIKGDGNAQFWQNLQNGLPTPKPQIPFVYKKFEAMLHASGINIRNDGSKKILLPLIDSQTHEMAGNNEITSFGMLDHNFEPIKNGLFDPQTTGGSNGNKWAKITLAHPIVNPLYETPVKTLLDLKDSEFKSILKEEGGHEKIKNLLANIQVHEQIDALVSSVKTAPKTKKDKLLKKLKILKSLDSLNLNPHDAYTTSVVPVVPPSFRPIFEIPGGHVQTHSLNNLYRDLGTINNTIKDLGPTPELSEALYHSLGAIQGVSNPVTKANEIKGVKGAIQIITGSGSPKYGFFQNKVLRKQQDLSGRATAVLNNNLNMDQIAIPEKIAQVIYKPFAVKELINNGYSHKEATEHVENFNDVGKKAVQAAMADRPVLMNRAPSLHKFSIMAFQPTLTKGLSIEVPGLIVGPFGLDFDGDTTVLHVPVTEKARKESYGMMPSKNLYNPRTRSLNYTPDQESIIGLYLLSHNKEGLARINAVLPSDLHINEVSNKKAIIATLGKLAEKYPQRYNEITTKLKELGDHHSTAAGFSISLNDLKDNSASVKKEYKNALNILHSTSSSDQHKLEALLKADATVKSNALNDKTNNFVTMAHSGARGSSEQVKQILFAPGIMSDHNGNPLMRPVLGSYAQGMAFPDYWTTMYGARKGVLDKQLMTAKPGALNKEVVNTTMNIVVTKHDCGTKHGIPMNTSDNNLIGRYMIDGTLISKSNIDSVRKHHTSVDVRSPATCELPHGICQKCYGIDEYGKHPDIGHNIGIKSAQSATEPLTQAAMKTKHMGGTVSGGGGVFGGFETVNNFLVAPETFKNKATLSTLSGQVKDITPGSAGGFHVNIDGTSHFVTPKSGDLKIKKGDHVKKGDLLNYGIPHPKDAMHLLGEIGGIHKITETLHDIYTNSGIAIDRRNLETVVRGMTGFGIVKDEGTHKHFVQGDTVPLSQIYEFNQHADTVHNLPLHDAYGMILHENIGSFKAGSRVDQNMINSLQKHHKKIDVKQAPVKYERTVLGVQQAPLKTRDWMSQLGFRYLKRGLQEGATYGYKSDIHGTAPIPSFVTGQLGDPSELGHY